MADGIFDALRAKIGNFFGDVDCNNLTVRGSLTTQGTMYNQGANQAASAGTLGYNPQAGSVSGIITETTQGQTNMPIVTVTVGSGRRIKITAYCPSFSGTVANDVLEARIKEGSTVLQAADFTPYGGGARIPVEMVAVVTPSAGSHTYYVSALLVSGTGSASWGGPSFILAEDIGT